LNLFYQNYIKSVFQTQTYTCKIRAIIINHISNLCHTYPLSIALDSKTVSKPKYSKIFISNL
ncbi:unnamed protein product, partial [Callosobruchus maculatus]